jgi:putative hydrolase of the HAD superfamily
MKAIAFDLGDTLVEYEGLPLSWESHYVEALANLASFLRLAPTPDQINRACAVLRRYNTRHHPRTNEVTFATILGDMLRCFDFDGAAEELPCAEAFFRIFRRRLRCFPEAGAALGSLQQQGIRIGVFTDVPYGMPRELVLEDVDEAALSGFFDTLLTSRDAGFRKPSPETLRLLATKLSCAPDEMAYVGNEKKDVEVARNFGCWSILIDRPAHGNNWGQDRTIRSLSEL